MAGAAVAALAVSASVASVMGGDGRTELCPVKGNSILAEFEIPSARRYAMYLPRMARSPELERDLPAWIVVFDGPADLEVLGAPPAIDEDGVALPREFEREQFFGVICVVVGGDATVYSEVDTTGWRQP